MTRKKLRWIPPLVLAVLAAAACSNQGGLANPSNTATSGAALTAADVDQLILGAVSQATVPVAVAVTDRQGEVLGAFVMNGRDVIGNGIIDSLTAADVQLAISKAATAAAFQSEQEAFTTRTAFFIVQGHYPPNVVNTAGGPLFGVQDSGQPSSDAHVIAFDQSGTACGTGISGVFGGVPIFKSGAPVGGIGVTSVSVIVSQGSPLDPTLAPTLTNGVQRDLDEQVARGGSRFFETPPIITATNVFVDGIGFPFYGPTVPPSVSLIAASTSSIPATVGAMDPRYPIRSSPIAAEQRVSGQYGIGTQQRYIGRVVARASAVFSGAFTNVDRPAGAVFDTATFKWKNVPIQPIAQATLGAIVGENRTPPIDGVEPPPAQGGLTAADVNTVIQNAVNNARTTVAGIRLPRGTSTIVHVAVCDARGNILGVFRMGDGTLFSFDVAVQKARTAAFFSSDSTGGLPTVAVTPRAIGFIAQPFFPPGIATGEPGPLVRLRDLVNRGKITIEFPPSLTLINPPPRPPSDGTTDENPLVGGFQRFNDFAGAVPVELGAIRGAIAGSGGVPILADRPDVNWVSPGLQSGLQTFPGGVPLYKGGKLVGAIGCSGDGVDEDDAASLAGSAGFESPPGTRCDEVPEGAFDTVIKARIDTIVAAILAHPDSRIRNVYGPIVQTERTKIDDRFSRGLSGVRIPYVKLPRNPGDF